VPDTPAPTTRADSPIRRRSPSGSLVYLAKLLEETEDCSPGEVRTVAKQVAFTLRVLAMDADHG